MNAKRILITTLVAAVVTGAITFIVGGHGTPGTFTVVVATIAGGLFMGFRQGLTLSEFAVASALVAMVVIALAAQAHVIRWAAAGCVAAFLAIAVVEVITRRGDKQRGERSR